MAMKYLIASGNISNPAVWNGGTKPVTGDDIWANGFTGTVDEDIVWNTMNNYASAPAAEGGSFTCSTARSITANIYGGAVSTYCLTTTGTFSLFTLIGDVHGGTGSSRYGLLKNHMGDVNWVGNGYGGLGNSGMGFYFNAAGTMTHTGNGYGGVGTSSYGVYMLTGTYNGTGSYYGGSGATAFGLILFNTGSPSANVVNGNGYSGTGSQAAGIYCSGTGNTVINGYAVTGATAYYLSFGVYANSPNHVPTIIGFITDTDGHHPVSGFVKYASSGVNCTVYRGSGEQIVLTDNSDYPAELDVREGVNYNFTTKTGTLAVPPKATVSLGVPTDDGVGTLELTVDASALAEDLLNEISASPLPLAVRLKNVATIQSTGAQITAG